VFTKQDVDLLLCLLCLMKYITPVRSVLHCSHGHPVVTVDAVFYLFPFFIFFFLFYFSTNFCAR